MERKLFLPMLLGTVREGRESEKVARWLLERAGRHPEIDTRLFDPREMNLDFRDEGQRLKLRNPEWRDAVMRADGLILVFPEYNHCFPGSLKFVLDMLLKEYIHKTVGLVGVSAGSFAGSRAIDHLVPVVRELGLCASFTDLNFPAVGKAFNPDGTPVDAGAWERRADGFLTELVWLSKTLRWGREHLPSRHHELPARCPEHHREGDGGTSRPCPEGP